MKRKQDSYCRHYYYLQSSRWESSCGEIDRSNFEIGNENSVNLLTATKSDVVFQKNSHVVALYGNFVAVDLGLGHRHHLYLVDLWAGPGVGVVIDMRVEHEVNT